MGRPLSTHPLPSVGEDVSDLIGVFDFFDPAHAPRGEAYAAYARSHCPVAHSTARGGHYIVTRYEDACQVLDDPETFSSNPDSSIMGTLGVRMPPIDTDPPIQRDFRKVLNPYFHPRLLAEQEAEVVDIARSNIARFADSGRCDVIEDFVNPYVTDVLARVVFAESDESVFRTANDYITRISHGESSAFGEFGRFLMDFVNRRRDAPQGPDDLVWALNTATIDGREITDQERVGAVLILFIGGLDTTKVAIANIIHQITVNPALEATLREPGWERKILDELLRLDAPVTALGRIAMKDTTVGGQPIKAGDRLAVHFASANRDAEAFANPDELVLDRARNPHLSFGLGVHRCIGMHLARMQIRVAMDEFLAVATDIRLQDGADLTRHVGVTPIFNQLPITFSRR